MVRREWRNIDLEGYVKELLDHHNTRDFKRINYNLDDLFILFDRARTLFIAEPPLLEVAPPVVVVGDIHGQIRDLLRIFDRFSTEDTHGCLTTRYVFLGDYVDRGPNSLEVVVLLFSLKLLFPTCFGLLRGNHETRSLNRCYGFYDELVERFAAQAEEVHLRLNEAFDCLPIAARICGKILAMHGGIGEDIMTLQDIRRVHRPLGDLAQSQVGIDLLWADPMLGMQSNFVPNKDRQYSVNFSVNALKTFCNNNGITHIIRAHQMPQVGTAFFGNRRIITIFSVPNYTNAGDNIASVAQISEEGTLSFKYFCSHVLGPALGESAMRKRFEAAAKDHSWISVWAPEDVTSLEKNTTGSKDELTEGP